MTDQQQIHRRQRRLSNLLGQRPIIEVFDSPAALVRERPHLELRRSLGFKSEELDAAAIGDLEPALAGKFDHGLLFPDWRAVSDTEGFIAALTESFIAQGGIRLRDEVRRIDESADRASGVTLAGGQRLPASLVVVAAGTGSRRFFGHGPVQLATAWALQKWKSFRRLWTAQMRSHSCPTATRLRKENCRKQRASLICPKTGSTVCFRSR